MDISLKKLKLAFKKVGIKGSLICGQILREWGILGVNLRKLQRCVVKAQMPVKKI